MKYMIRVENDKIKELENEEKYLELTRMLIEEIKYNYETIKLNNNVSELTKIYESISYLGKDNNLLPETEKKILELIKFNRTVFITNFNNYNSKE